MSDYKTRLAHYNDIEWQATPQVAKAREIHSKLADRYGIVDFHEFDDAVREDTRFFNRLTLLSYYIPLIALVAAALWLSVLPGVVIYAVVCGLATIAVNNVAEALGDE